MSSFYLFGLFYGLILLIISLRVNTSFKKAEKFLESIEVSYPRMKEKKHQFSLLKFYFQKLLWYFRNVYTQEKGINTKGFLIVFICMVLFVVANSLFLNFAIIFPIVLGIFFGGYVANTLHFKALKNDFEKNFPEALVIISGAITSGNNITQALLDCANSIDGALADEFKYIVRSLNVGDDPSKVFALSYARLPFGNYYFFLTSLLVSIKSGARIKEVLSRLSTATTKAKSMEKKKHAITSEVRMSSKITAAIPFAFLILMKFISPDNFDYIMNDPSGRYILYYFLISEGIGMMIILFLMRKI